MAILLTGGTGKTSKHVARFLQEANIPFLLASRRVEAAAPAGEPATKFDWLDYSTHENPFQHEISNGERISAVYLIAPEVQDPAPSMNAFIDIAVEKPSIKRFVLLSGSSLTKGGFYTGQVWQHLEDIGVDHTVLSYVVYGYVPYMTFGTWRKRIMANDSPLENFSNYSHQITIKTEGKIYTACEDGKISFVNAADIARVAFHALTDTKSHNTDYRILGPELLTYDEVYDRLFGPIVGVIALSESVM